MKIAYIYDPQIGYYYYGKNHPMKLHRLTLTHSLVHSYKLDALMDIHTPKLYSLDEILYNMHKNMNGKMDVDCPEFPGLDQFVQHCVSGTIAAAQLLGIYDRVINWGGGMHHGKKDKPSGFCYVNDIVFAVQELLDSYDRILYIDIDIHHGDGVEQSFYGDKRVMTLSFHKYGDGYFPGTGALFSNGVADGYGYALNVPLHSGITDSAYMSVFRPIVTRAVEKYKPQVIIMQCGADSVAGDKLGCFNLSIDGHANCVKLVNQFDVPILFLGGGGYTPEFVARTWCMETAVICGVDVDMVIPDNPFIEHFGDKPLLNEHGPYEYEDKNRSEYLESLIEYTNYILDNIDN